MCRPTAAGLRLGARTGAFQQLFNETIHSGLFKSKRERAIAKVARTAISSVIEESILNDVEIGGAIYELGGKFYSTEAVRAACDGGESCSINPQIAADKVPSGGTQVADWHTHEASGSPDFNWFSLEDLAATNTASGSLPNFMGSFVGTPNRQVLFYRPGSFNSGSYISVQALLETNEPEYWQLTESSRSMQDPWKYLKSH